MIPAPSSDVQDSVPLSSPVHIQAESNVVSPSEPQTSIHTEVPISEQPGLSETQPGVPHSSASQPFVEPSIHESTHESAEPIQIDDSPQHSVDTYHPPDAYAQVFAESSQPSAPTSEPPTSSTTPPVQSSEPVVSKAQSTVPSSMPTPTEWHRHVASTPPVVPVSGPDSSAQENTVLFRFISAQFAAIQSKLDSKFAILERTVNSKMEQLQIKLEKHITEYSYS